MDLVTYSFDIGEQILARRSQAERKRLGQFLTPPTIARYMARQLGPFRDGDTILDPAIGSGILIFHVNISTSQSDADLTDDIVKQKIASSYFLGKSNGTVFFRLPVSDLDKHIIDTVDLWPGSLQKFGLTVSTGPVVPFRAEAFLTEETDFKTTNAVPLLWLHNVQKQRIEWPVHKGNKCPSILLTAAEKKYLIYATAFPDFATYKSFANDIAWETEVWIAEVPDHLIHFNGGHFLGR